MAKTETISWDSAAYLRTNEEIANYLEAVFEDGDPALIAHGLGVVARARACRRVHRRPAWDGRVFYKALSKDDNPELATVLKVLQALGLKLKVEV